MAISAIFDLLLAVILYFYGPKKESNKWAVVFLIFTGLGSFSDVIVEPIPRNALFFILQACSPYGFLMFAIVYSEVTTRRIQRLLAGLLFLPIVMTFFITPMQPDIQMDFIILLLWAVPYYLSGCFLLISSYLREKDHVRRRNRLITVCFFVPAIMAIVVFNHIERVIDLNFRGYFNISLFVWGAFAFFIISSIRFGVLGVKIKFEKQLHDQTIKGIATGAAMLNHAMKNRITNINMLTERVKEIAYSQQQGQMDGEIERILAETKQMMQMVIRIQKQIEDIEIVEGAANLVDIMAQALNSNRYLLESKGISVHTDYSVNCGMLCDKVHLQEVFNNIIRNAVDAVEAEAGTLAIRIYESKNSVRIDCTDNGRGMDRETAAQIFDPFYSTKQREDNFGLGLSYCYLIMQKHGGSIDVASSPDEGTTFTVHLPKYRKM
jgi:signal transduction histidine kinase